MSGTGGTWTVTGPWRAPETTSTIAMFRRTSMEPSRSKAMAAGFMRRIMATCGRPRWPPDGHRIATAGGLGTTTTDGAGSVTNPGVGRHTITADGFLTPVTVD